MIQLDTKSTLQKRIGKFVDWIAPESGTRDQIKKQADEIRNCISEKAIEDDITIMSMPYAGSFQKKTGLRRHYRGHSEVEGQDVDIPFIIKPKDINGNEIVELLQRFKGYAEKAYPKTNIEVSKSSVKLNFSSTLSYDLVPLLATDHPEKQILIRSNGERRDTSIVKHTEFIKSRTAESKKIAGRVLFNECVRLVKWWRCFCQVESGIFDNDDNKVPSFLIDLLCAKAFDECSVQETYAHTLSDWFGFIENLIENRVPIVFSDCYSKAELDATALWQVFDPVNPKNNIVKKWNNLEIRELESWFAEAHNHLNRAIARDLHNDDAGSMEHLIKVFGNPFKNNAE